MFAMHDSIHTADNQSKLISTRANLRLPGNIKIETNWR